MRLFLFLISITLISCNNYVNNLAKEEYVENRKFELESGKRHDTIFLNYRFRMNPEEFAVHTQNLIKEDKLYISDEDLIVYKLNIPDYTDSEYYLTFEPQYFEDKLYKLQIQAVDKYTPGSKFAQMKLVELYTKKYNSYDHELKGYKDDQAKDYVFLDGNREIRIKQGYNDVRIDYIDNAVEYEAMNYELDQNRINQKRRKDSLAQDL